MKILILLLLSLSLWANIGNIMAMKGSAQIQRDGLNIQAKIGMELEQADRVITAQKSRVQVMLKDETVVTIGANSNFSFDTYVFDGTDKSEISMSTQRGFFRSVTGKIGKIAPQRFKVKTASATIGIRGTDFSGEISADVEIIKCYAGVIFVVYDGVEYDVEAGMFMKITKGGFDILPMEQEVAKDDDAKVNSINENQIPTEVVADITQVTNDSDNGEGAGSSEDAAAEPFTVSPGATDRPVQY